jgi:cysteine desulfurase/selenocysteine lyase
MDVGKIRKDFPALGCELRGKPIVYLDNACMTLKSRQVIDAMMQYYECFPACAGRSVHKLSTMVEEHCQSARKRVAKFLDAKSEKEIVFTRNTTEGINLVAYSLGFRKGDIVVTSDREHNSNLLPWHALRDRAGIAHRVVKSNEDETFSLENFKREVKGAKLVSMVHTSNLDGYTLPIREITGISHDEGALVMVDAAQSAPHKPLSVRKLGADFLACSGHKLTGPTGTGALYGRYELLEKMNTFMLGGETVETSTYKDHELLNPPEKYEAGLQDYAGIIGFGAAVEYLSRLGKESMERHEVELNRIITEGIRDVKGLRILGPQEPGMRSGIVSFLLEGMDHHQVAMLLDGNANIMIRSGHHCVSSWFNAHGLKGSARASLYLYNTREEAEKFVEELKKVAGLR